MIQEAYVSFEVAKLLKEKGFNEPCFYYYKDKDLMFSPFLKGRNSYQTDTYSAPTHQMAMAWLRREKSIHMSIDTVISSNGNIYFNIDTYSKDSGWHHPVDFYDSYEDAVEAALKYSLENLL